MLKFECLNFKVSITPPFELPHRPLTTPGKLTKGCARLAAADRGERGRLADGEPDVPGGGAGESVRGVHHDQQERPGGGDHAPHRARGGEKPLFSKPFFRRERGTLLLSQSYPSFGSVSPIYRVTGVHGPLRNGTLVCAPSRLESLFE